MVARISSLVALLICTAVNAAAIDWPDTPGARAAQAYFSMQSDGSDQAIARFQEQYRSSSAKKKASANEWTEKTKSLRNTMGVFEPKAVTHTSAKGIVVAAVTSSGVAVDLEFAMSSKEPGKLDSIGIGVAPDAAQTPMPLTEQGRAELVEGVAKAVAENYVFPDRGTKMAAKLRDGLKSGAYSSITEERIIAAKLTADLRSVSNDLHLGVHLAPAGKSEHEPSPMAQGDFARRDNYAFRKIEVLAGNIGYLRLDLFLDMPEATRTADAAMAFLKNVDVLVVDLRYNHGGSPKMIAYLTSYLFAQPTLLNTMMDRNGKIVEEYRTGDVAGARLRADLPVYVLTSSETFSGAEEFAYNLKNLKRATLVGETTGGGAHPVQGMRVSDRFIVAVPYERAVNPITKTNWEGVGVQPDVKVPADDALDKALDLARDAERKQRAGGRSASAKPVVFRVG
jgi:retinol-binding protein 3